MSDRSAHSASAGPEPEVLRWYTRARRVPTLIGRLPRGGRLPGGPYTVTQAVGSAVVFMAGQKTMGLWGVFGWMGDWVALIIVSAGALFGLRLVKTGGRDPVTALCSVLGLGTGSAAGQYEGRSVRLPRTQRVTHHVNARVRRPDLPTGSPPVPCTPVQAPAPTAPAHSSTARPAAGPRPLTAVQQLLAAAPARGKES